MREVPGSIPGSGLLFFPLFLPALTNQRVLCIHTHTADAILFFRCILKMYGHSWSHPLLLSNFNYQQLIYYSAVLRPF